MKKLLLTLALLLAPSFALAQCNGVFPNNTVCGNVSGASNLPRAVANSVLTGVPGGTAGQVQYNIGGTTFGGFTLSGDGTVNTSTGAFTLSTVNANVGSFGSTTQCTIFTVNGKGLITAASQSACISGLVVPTTAITGGTSGAPLYNNAGALATGAVSSIYSNFAAPGTGGVTNTVAVELTKTLVWIKDYGAVCDGATDDTTAIQNAWNYAASIGTNVWLGNVGTSCVITQITMPTPTAVPNAGGLGQGRSAMLVGPGSNQVTLLTNVTGGNCAITISATYGTNSSLGGTFSGFGLRQSTNSQVGYGFCLTGITKLKFSDIRVNQFNVAFNGNDVITITIDQSNFSANNNAILAQKVSHSPPNVWIINNTSFDSNLKNTITLSAGTANMIQNCVFETNGATLDTAAETILVTESASSPNLLLTVINSYFENNYGTLIGIDENAQTSVNVVNVIGNQFSRSLASQIYGVFVNTTGTGNSYTIVNVDGNAFQDGIGGSFSWLGAGGTVNYLYKCTSVPNVSNANINATCVIATTGFN